MPKSLLFLIPLLFLLGCGSFNLIGNGAQNGEISGDFSGCAVGAFVNGMENIPSFEALIGKKLAVVLWYVHWQDPFPSAEADSVSSNGSIPLITWEPWITHPLGTLEAIASGSYEAYAKEFLLAAKAWGKPLFLRFAHEMNGNWYPWDGWHNGAATSGPTVYKRAWIYIYNLRQELSANNVNLVWCPNNHSQPAEAWNDISDYYPGDQYVDWIGMDGYNWGYTEWQTFDSIFGGIYSQLTQLTSKPLMISEFASATSETNSKPTWITDTFDKIESQYPSIKLFCWFNINKERDWRVDSSSDSATAFKNALQKPYFLGKI
jgi:beta-mannanase